MSTTNPQQQSTPINDLVIAEMRRRGLSSAVDILSEGKPSNHTETYLAKFLSSDVDMIELKDKIRKLAPHNISVLIVGETGTGKELLANALHGNRQGKFVAVNAAGIPDTLLEAEFFGAKRGAYTGCEHDRNGYLAEANGGTLFMDEIGDLPLLLQCKLLRAIQENKYRRLGDNVERTFSCRFVSATNCDDLNNSKSFRRDFYYRIAGVVLKTKPLRERGDDGKLIVETLYPTINWRNLPIHEPFHGNVRELLNYCEEYKILWG